jgi:hypothetical protein
LLVGVSWVGSEDLRGVYHEFSKLGVLSREPGHFHFFPKCYSVT